MYKTLEKAAFNINIERMTHGGLPDYDAFFESRVPLNVAMIGLLTAVRLYHDTLVRHTRACLLESKTVKDDVEKLRSEQYDKHLEYRFMEQLRNHVQHYGLPVDQLSMGSNAVRKRTLVLLKWDDSRIRLQKRNAHLTALRSSHATTKAREPTGDAKGGRGAARSKK